MRPKKKTPTNKHKAPNRLMNLVVETDAWGRGNSHSNRETKKRLIKLDSSLSLPSLQIFNPQKPCVQSVSPILVFFPLVCTIPHLSVPNQSTVFKGMSNGFKIFSGSSQGNPSSSDPVRENLVEQNAQPNGFKTSVFRILQRFMSASNNRLCLSLTIMSD